VRVPHAESNAEKPDTELQRQSDAILERFRDARVLRPIAQVKAWDAEAALLISAGELRDAWRTLKEAYRRRDPELDEWQAAFHRKLEAFLNQ